MLPIDERSKATIGDGVFGSSLSARGRRSHVLPEFCFLERLPSEVLWYLSRFLSLASLIVLSTATSRTLKQSFGQFSRPSLFLKPLHRLSLAEWRVAARDLEQLGLTSRSCAKTEGIPTSNPSLAKLNSENLLQTCEMLSKDDSLVDLHLLQDILAFLQISQDFTTSTRGDTPRLTCLSLLGWHGIAGSFLVNQLRTQPTLCGVRAIVKTERADSRIWHQVAIDGQRKQIEPFEQVSMMRKARDEASTRLATRIQAWKPESNGPTTPFSFEACTKTQAIVQVGRRRPRLAGQPWLKGEGLQIGYESYCLQIARPTESDINPAESSESQNHTLHVIVQGREGPDSDTSDQTTHMLERSIITCNHCKEQITF